jgi:hypothetical protein
MTLIDGVITFFVVVATFSALAYFLGYLAAKLENRK